MFRAALISLTLSAVICVAMPGFHEDSWSEAGEELSSSSSSCDRDTGGSCYLTSCYPWRHGATCNFGSCVCPEGRCAYQGQCLPAGQKVPAPSPPPCEMKTGGTCRLQDCEAWRNAECSGFSLGFSTGITLGQCVCKAGTCADSTGKCVPSQQAPPKKLETKKIVCPVLASIFNQGLFDADSYGRVERLNVQKGCKEGLNMDDDTAFFFGITTAGYKQADVDSINFSMVPIDAAQKMKKEALTQEPAPEYVRYLNVFEMATNSDVMHQIGAAVRGGPPDQSCRGNWPCKTRYVDFFGRFAQKGRFYLKDWGNVASNIWQNGYHGPGGTSLFSIGLGIAGREFMALCGYFVAFSKEDENGERYIPEKWLHTMQMHGVFPDDWKPTRQWGFSETSACMSEWIKMGVKGVPNQLKLQDALLKFKG